MIARVQFVCVAPIFFAGIGPETACGADAYSIVEAGGYYEITHLKVGTKVVVPRSVCAATIVPDVEKKK